MSLLTAPPPPASNRTQDRFAIPKALQGGNELKAAIQNNHPALTATAVFSLVINILMLTGPIFMLQVYDRVLTSGSVATLVTLTLLTLALYGVIAALEIVRSRILIRVAHDIDHHLSTRIFEASLRRTLKSPDQQTTLRDLDALRSFIAGPGPITLFDAPWTPVYLVVIFLLHWTLGIAAALGAMLLVSLAWISETSSRTAMTEAGKAAVKSAALAENAHRNAEALAAMGMTRDYCHKWSAAQSTSLRWQMCASDRLGTTSSLSKALRLLLQSMMLALGAGLALSDLISAGTIVAATIMFGRAMAPVEQAIGQWRTFIKVRETYANLDALLVSEPVEPPKTTLPRPQGQLSVAGLTVIPPGSTRAVLTDVQFKLAPGEMLAVIGPSASGKSSLSRALVGVWSAPSGTIRLDGAPIEQWDRALLGRHIGFLPQSVEIFNGTVRENISRFRREAADEEVVEAARQATCHEMILSLPSGYDTPIGPLGMHLSAGQRQRIGLARALFGQPALVVLDEPNSNLDRDGDEALTAAIAGMKSRNQAIVIVSHRIQAIQLADYLLYLDRGKQQAFGPRQTVMQLFQGKNQPGPQRRRTDIAQSGPAFDGGDKL